MKGITYQTKLFVIYSLVFFVITGLLIGMFYMYSSQVLINEAMVSMQQVSSNLSNKLDIFVNLMDVVSTQVIANKDVQTVMNSIRHSGGETNYFDYNLDDSRKLRQALSSINSPLIAYGRIGIFDNNQNHISTGNLGSDSASFRNNFEKYNVLSQFDLLRDRKLILPPHNDNWITADPPKQVISLLREISDIQYNSFEVIGYVEVQQPYSYIERICEQSIDARHTIVVIDKNKQIIYPYNTLSEQQLNSYKSLPDNGDTASVVSNPQKQLVVCKSSAETGWTTIVAQDEADYMTPVWTLRSMTLLFSLLFYLLTFAVIFFITRSLTLPIRRFRSKIKDLSIGNLSLDLSVDSNDEIVLLNKAFDEALKQLDQSIKHSLSSHIREINAHMLALQAQMNPHFLFNTLMAINGIAVKEQNHQITSMCSQLSHMLRYIAAYQEQAVTLLDEMNYAESYLQLMKVRYEDFLQYYIDIEEAVYTEPIPKLIIQPIVENCFAHGFTEIQPPYSINIRARHQDDMFLISVHDNGCGMDEKVRMELLGTCEAYNITQLTEKEQLFNQTDQRTIVNYLENSHLGGIGLTNIYVRLKLLWGERFIFALDNDDGLTVTIGRKITGGMHDV